MHSVDGEGREIMYCIDGEGCEIMHSVDGDIGRAMKLKPRFHPKPMPPPLPLTDNYSCQFTCH